MVGEGDDDRFAAVDFSTPGDRASDAGNVCVARRSMCHRWTVGQDAAVLGKVENVTYSSFLCPTPFLSDPFPIDAHIAALASEYGMMVYSKDTDFVRFPGVKVINPLEGSSQI